MLNNGRRCAVYYWPCAISIYSANSSYMCNRLDNSSIIFLMKVEDYEIFMNERIFIEVNLIIPGNVCMTIGSRLSSNLYLTYTIY